MFSLIFLKPERAKKADMGRNIPENAVKIFLVFDVSKVRLAARKLRTMKRTNGGRQRTPPYITITLEQDFIIGK